MRARIYDELLYRHWTAWSEGKRLHLFVVPSSGGAARDLIPGADYDVPPPQREGPHPIAFAPDSRTIAYTAVADRVEATSTNGDLFEVDVTGAGMPKRLTTNPGFDGAPAYSPDGRTIAYRSQARAGYESDKWRLMLFDRASGRQTSLTDGSIAASKRTSGPSDGRSIYLQRGRSRSDAAVFHPGHRRHASSPTAGMFDGEFDMAADALIVARSSAAAPTELYRVDRATGSATPLTSHNAMRLAALDLANAEPFTFAGAGGTQSTGCSSGRRPSMPAKSIR